MRHFRNLLWFFVGILLVSIPMYSYALNIQLGKYFQMDNAVVRSMSETARVVSTNNFTGRMADSVRVNLTSDLVVNMEKGLVRVPITDTIAADVGVFTKLGRQASRCLSTGIAIAACAAGAAATAVIADKLIEKGHEVMDAAKCQVTAGCTTPGWQKAVKPSNSYPTGGLYHDKNGKDSSSLTELCAIRASTNTPSYHYTCVPSPPACVFESSIDNPKGSIDCVLTVRKPAATCPDNYTLSSDKTICYPSPSAPSTYSPVTQDVIDSATDDIVKNNIAPFVDAVRKDGTTISVDDATKTITSATPAIGPAIPSQKTVQNPDGSTSIETKQTQNTYTPTSTGNAADPIIIKTTTTETTNTCTGAGSCTTTNTTKTEPTPETKTQCDLYPNSLGCTSLGTPQDADIPSKTVNTDYQQDGRISFAHTCPAPQQYMAHGVPYYSDWTLLCQYSTKIKPLIIGAAAFLAALIIAYGHKS